MSWRVIVGALAGLVVLGGLGVLGVVGGLWVVDAIRGPDPEYRWAQDVIDPAWWLGEAVDVTGDDDPEFFVFGDPAAPVVEADEPALSGELATILAALVAAVALMGSTWWRDKRQPASP